MPVKAAAIRDYWEKVREVWPNVRRKKEKVEGHYGDSPQDRDWNEFIESAVDDPEFIRQLKRNPLAPDKDVLHATRMSNMRQGDTLADVESEKEIGGKYQVKALPGGDLSCTCGDWRYRGSVKPGYKCKHIRAYEQGSNKVAQLVATGLEAADILLKKGSFSKDTSAFMDELSKIREAQMVDKDENREHQGERPFSNMLTQDEEPSDYNPHPTTYMDQPEIILGGNG